MGHGEVRVGNFASGDREKIGLATFSPDGKILVTAGGARG